MTVNVGLGVTVIVVDWLVSALQALVVPFCEALIVTWKLVGQEEPLGEQVPVTVTFVFTVVAGSQ